MTECIALLRGINVGRAKRIAMADLRSLFVDLGHQNVRTVLNSGNVLFRCARPNVGQLALAIQNAIADSCAVSTSVTVITARKLAAIIRENPLLPVIKDPSRHLVAFVAHPRLLGALEVALGDVTPRQRRAPCPFSGVEAQRRTKLGHRMLSEPAIGGQLASKHR